LIHFHNQIVEKVLEKPIRTRFIRFYPLKWFRNISMRVEVYHVHPDPFESLQPVGVRIEDSIPPAVEPSSVDLSPPVPLSSAASMPASAVIDPPLANAEDANGQWQCSVCTYLNEPLHMQCDVCQVNFNDCVSF
jgi:hypothetical protein